MRTIDSVVGFDRAGESKGLYGSMVFVSHNIWVIKGVISEWDSSIVISEVLEYVEVFVDEEVASDAIQSKTDLDLIRVLVELLFVPHWSCLYAIWW